MSFGRRKRERERPRLEQGTELHNERERWRAADRGTAWIGPDRGGESRLPFVAVGTKTNDDSWSDIWDRDKGQGTEWDGTAERTGWGYEDDVDAICRFSLAYANIGVGPMEIRKGDMFE